MSAAGDLLRELDLAELAHDVEQWEDEGLDADAILARIQLYADMDLALIREQFRTS